MFISVIIIYNVIIDGFKLKNTLKIALVVEIKIIVCSYFMFASICSFEIFG